ncbi:MAG TPA: cytidyltransferase, partial [Bacillota bacterium]|nr:cytidyltransferase [Bacillota bacterium]
MKLNQEVLGFNTLDHICGVHYLALYIGRELKKAGIPIDLGRVSGAAAGHDIGKYGCKSSESKRVPYLHYYYTDLWFRNHDITYIGHIATNHSTWDLELENLPLESLVLIYSDFRVKHDAAGNTREMHIYPLKDSFKIILDKLDNLDAVKEKKYRRVYSKLADFEDYLISLGIEVDINNIVKGIRRESGIKNRHYSLMSGNQVINNIKYLAINHNINLMYQLRDEASLNLILESARSEANWKKLREYIRIFEEYSTYLTQKQKLITIRFLYEQLVHPEDDIRRQCAELIGLLIARFDEKYRKDVPENAILDTPAMTSFELLDRYMQLLVSPDHKIVPLHKSYLGYSISIIISSLFSHCGKSQTEGFRTVAAKYYKEGARRTNETKLYLLEAIRYIPVSGDYETDRIICSYVKRRLNDKSNAIRLSAMNVAYDILARSRKNTCISGEDTAIGSLALSIKEMISRTHRRSGVVSENYLKYKIACLLGMEPAVLNRFHEYCHKDLHKLSEISLSNLKTATEWVIKRIQLDLLLDNSLRNPKSSGFYSAMHFCNLMKVSASESVRNRAGEALTHIVSHLSPEQRNDIAVEMLRALEIEGYQFAEYIPNYLGKIILSLEPVELDEVLDDFKEKIKNSTPHLDSLILKTIGITIANYPSYKKTFKEKREVYENRLLRMLSIIINGLAHYDADV